MEISIAPEIISDPGYDNNDTYLWIAVLDRAVRDLIALERFRQDPNVMKDPVFLYDYRTLIKWFHSSSMEPGSFSWICSLVNIDQRWALSQLRKRIKICLVSKPIETEAKEKAASTWAKVA